MEGRNVPLWPWSCKPRRSAVGGRKWSGGGAERIAKRNQSATAPPRHRRKRKRMQWTEKVPLVTSAAQVALVTVARMEEVE